MPDKSELLTQIARHCWRGAIWKKTPKGPRHIKTQLTFTHLREHLDGSGPPIGLAPITPGTGETSIAVLDMDSHKGEVPWDGMCMRAAEIASTLREMHYAPIMFRSSGGAGIHIYLLWESPQSAADVRALLTKALRVHGFKPGSKGVAQGEIEVFPKQSYVPETGAGNMFVLPWAGQSELLTETPAESWPQSPPVPALTTVQPSSTVAPPVQPTSLADVRSALAAIDPGEFEYDAWRNIVFAIHHASDGSDEGYELAQEWSARSPKHNPEFLETEVWPYIRSDRDQAITARTIFAEASKHGWVESCEDDFDVVAYVEPPPSPPKLQRFRVVERDEFTSRPPPSWIIKGVLPQAELGMVYGESTAGKSFAVLDVAAAIDLGIPWRGHRTKRARVVIIVAEGAADFRNRMVAYEQHHGVKLSLGVIPDTPNLLEGEDVKALVAVLKARGVDLIVVDTYAQTTVGGDENSAKDTGRAVAACRALHRHTGATVLLVHHAGKDVARGARGSSSLKAACDFELEVTRDGEHRQLKVSKLKGGQDGPVYPFRLATVEVGKDDEGDPITSCVVEAAEARGKTSGRTPRGKNDRFVWQAVCDLLDLGDTPSVSVRDVVDTAVSRMPEMPSSKGVDRRKDVVRRALSALQEQRYLAIFDGEIRVVSE